VFELSKYYLQKDNSSLEKSDIIKLQELINFHSDLYYNKQNLLYLIVNMIYCLKN